ELRNPMGAIGNGVFLLKQLLPPNPDIDELQGIIDRQLKQLGKLLDDLLDASRIERGKVTLQCEPLDLTTAVQNVAKDNEHFFEAETIAFKVVVLPEPVCISADSTRVVQALGNLLQNALKFTNRGGTVDMILKQVGNEAHLSIVDTGIGIEPEVLPT